MTYEGAKYKELFELLKTKLNTKEEYIKEVIDNIIFILIERRKTEEVDNKKLEEFTNYAKEIMTDVYEDYLDRSNSKNNITEDIEYISSGFTTIAFRVGDNVIKIGKSEHSLNQPKLDTIFQVPTYIRENHQLNNKTHFRIEVSPYVDSNNISYEEVYQTYKNIRNLGYIWYDPKEENIGRNTNLSSCIIGNKTYYPKHDYKQGDLVIIDLDDIAYVGEFTSDIILEEISMMSYNRNVYRFETRYMEEKNKQRQ